MDNTSQDRLFLDRINDAVLGRYTLVDVRSPSEFARGHIPGAHNIPLFSDQLRALVGCVYAQRGKDAAMHVALQHIGPNMTALVDQARAVFKQKPLCVYCARGGMRSGAVTWLYQFFKMPVVQLPGGYKAFRNWALEQFMVPRQVRILAGYTGSGKTALLHEWAAQGQQVIDLEALADHKSSVFGGDKDAQATQQQFENDLACAWAQLRGGPVWIEDESRKIGSVILPEAIWKQMQQAPVYVLDVNRAQRLQRVMAEYGTLDEEFLLAAVMQIKEPLGGTRYQEVVRLIKEGNRLQAADILLSYYDDKYGHGLLRKQDRTVATLPERASFQ